MGNKESKEPGSCMTRKENRGNNDKTLSGASSDTRTFVEPGGESKEKNKSANDVCKISADDKPVDERTRLAFEEWLYERLTKYFEDIQEHVLKLNICNDERSDIGDAVDEVLNFLFTETEVVDRRFRINSKDIIKVGTFHENLDIIHVDQLQYCIVIDDLSRENILIIQKEPTQTDEYLKVYLTDNCALRWDECVEDEDIDKHWLRSDRGIATTFFDRVAKAAESVRAKSRASIYRKHGRLDLLQVNGVRKRAATVELKFTWNADTIITVILTPCLRIDDIVQFIDDNLTLGKLANKALQSTKMLLLQPVEQTGEYFQWNFGHAEKEFMNIYI